MVFVGPPKESDEWSRRSDPQGSSRIVKNKLKGGKMETRMTRRIASCGRREERQVSLESVKSLGPSNF